MSEASGAADGEWRTEGLRAWLTAAAVSFVTSLAILTPFFLLGTASGHDVQFHIQSWIDAAGQWKEGILFPRWAEWANYGFGEPRFIFYPPFSWMLGAALGSVFPWTWIPGVLVLVVQTFAGLSAFALFRRTVHSFRGSLLGTAFFAANPYALLVIYLRSDFAELLGSAFLPLLFLATLRLAGFLKDATPVRKAFAHFGLCFAAVWLSNAPAGVLASYSVALLFAWAASTRNVQPLVRGAGGLALGFGLASFYLVPAAYEQKWVNIAGALAGGLKPSDNFLFAKTTDVEHDAFNRIASYVAVFLIAGIFFTAMAIWKRATGKDDSRKAFLLLSGVAAAMMLPLTNLLWLYLPKLRFVQFPWRWMMMLAVAFAYLLSAAAARRFYAATCVTMAALLMLTGVYLVKNTWWDTEDVNSVKEAVEAKVGFEGTDEYDPIGDDHTDIPQNQPAAKLIGASETAATTKPAIRVIRWTAEDRAVLIKTSEPATIQLRLLHHPAWRITVDGKPVKTGRTISYDAVLVSVPAGESRIEARFTRTLDRTIGGCLSLASLFVAAALTLGRKYPVRAQASGDQR